MMLPLRIRKAEVAMADGRLDDAYQQAIRDDVRDHRKGQRLITRLTKAYEKRSHVHLGAGNAQAALADVERATRLGGNQPNIVALRDKAIREFTAQQGKRHARSQQLAAAKRCLATGELSLGAKLCEGLEQPGNTVVGLMQDAELNRRKVESTVQRGLSAVKAANWDQAFDSIEEAKRVQPQHTDVLDLIRQVSHAVSRQVRTALAEGRLDHADRLLERLRHHAPEALEVQELAGILSQCRDAAASARSAELGLAVESLKSLKRIIPEARWLDAAVKDAEVVARSIESLRTGPLGTLAARSPTNTSTIIGQRMGSAPSMRPLHESPTTIPETLMLHLDGAGSFLVVRLRQVSVGPQSRSRPVDVPLLGQFGLPRITVERMEDDYFLSSDEAVIVSGKKTTNTLLTNQDQIRLGRRGSMHFSLPNSASTSAILDFAGVRLAHGNARRVILMDDALVIGPQPSAHIQTLALERAMVIHFRNGELRIRPMSRTMDTAGQVIAVDRPHDVDGLSLVVTGVREIA